MDLLESILRTCNSEKYLENFKSHQIDPFTLKALSGDDLKVLGIDEEELIQDILKHTSNLQIPSEKTYDCTVDEQYALLVLSQIYIHLHKHYANFCYAAKRDDVDLCPIQTSRALRCVEDCLDSLESELSQFENRLIKKVARKKKQHNVMVPTILLTGGICLLLACYLRTK